MIDINKKYLTRDGRSVRLFTTTASNPVRPVVGEVGGNIHMWTSEGKFSLLGRDSNYDLIEVKLVEIKPYRFYRKLNEVVYFTIINSMTKDIGLFHPTINGFYSVGGETIEFLADAEEIPNPFGGK